MPANPRYPRIPVALLSALLCVAALSGTGDSANERGTRTGTPPSLTKAEAEPTGETKTASGGLNRAAPTRLDIASIDVHTRVLHLALENDNTVEEPPLSHPELAAWYALGPSPGEVGAAVITGHLDSRTGPSVFQRLDELRAGDTVRVQRRDGSSPVFRISQTEQVHKSDFPTEKVYAPVDFPGIRLITCGGRFDSTVGHYEENLIVYGRMVEA